MAQQKQRKQPILIDGKNIFTYCFQPIQRLQPNFTTDGIRNFMAQQNQRKQPNFNRWREYFYSLLPINAMLTT